MKRFPQCESITRCVRELSLVASQRRRRRRDDATATTRVRTRRAEAHAKGGLRARAGVGAKRRSSREGRGASRAGRVSRASRVFRRTRASERSANPRPAHARGARTSELERAGPRRDLEKRERNARGVQGSARAADEERRRKVESSKGRSRAEFWNSRNQTCSRDHTVFRMFRLCAPKLELLQPPPPHPRASPRPPSPADRAVNRPRGPHVPRRVKEHVDAVPPPPLCLRGDEHARHRPERRPRHPPQRQARRQEEHVDVRAQDVAQEKARDERAATAGGGRDGRLARRLVRERR